VNGRPTTGKCEGGWTWQLEQGVYGDVKLGGLCDQRADAAQREALQSLVEGRSGGPNYVPYEVDSETRLPRVRGGDALTIETEYIRNPVTKETIHPRLALPEGLVVKDCALVASKRFTLRSGKVQYDHSGRYAAFGFFRYFGP
jgi:hypothetical protein